MGNNELRDRGTEGRVLLAAFFAVVGLIVVAAFVQANRGPLGPRPVPDLPGIIDLAPDGVAVREAGSPRWPGLPDLAGDEAGGDVVFEIQVAEPGTILELTVAEVATRFGAGVIGIGTSEGGVRVIPTLVIDASGDWVPAYRIVTPWNLRTTVDVPIVVQVDEVRSTRILRLVVAAADRLESPNDVIVSPEEMGNLQAIVDLRSGTPARFVLPPGEYREISVVPHSGQGFIGAGPEPTVLNGSRLVTSWTPTFGGKWLARGQDHVRWGFLDGAERVRPNPSDEEWGTCARGQGDVCKFPELLFFDDLPLRRVERREDVGPGTWYFDYAADEIVVVDDPRQREVEFAVTPGAFTGIADNVRIENLVVRQYASPMRQGAIQPRRGRIEEDPGRGWVLSGVEVSWNHGYGVKADLGMIIEQSWIHHNFHMGIGAGSSEDVVIRRSEIAYNCAGVANMGAKCEGHSGGGIKLDFSDRPTIRENFVHDNFPHGIHVDQFSTDAVIVGNVAVDNTLAGIHFEISAGALIEGNYAAGNGEAGILVISSSSVAISGNHVTANEAAILVRQDERCRPGRPQCVRDLLVTDNYVDVGDGSTGLTWSSSSAPNPYTSSAANVFDRNVYVIPAGNCRAEPFRWGKSSLDWRAWTARGLDGGGHIIWPECFVAAGESDVVAALPVVYRRAPELAY